MQTLTLPAPIAAYFAEVTGKFPGSPIDLTYRFRLERGLIASLEITA